MADPFSLAASVFATIQIADRLVAICKHYIESVQDAPSDLRAILIEISAVKTILENIDFLLKCDKGQSTMFDGLSGASGPIEGCRTGITELLDLLPDNQNQGRAHGKSRRRRVQVTLESLAWRFKETKAKKLLEDIARHKGTISLALTTDTAHGIKNIQRILTESQQNEVYKWLADIDPSSIHHQACRNHEPGTCDWISRLPEWSRFVDGQIRCLWIHGIPGAGKTILASQLIENLEQHCERLSSNDSQSLSIYYYCYFGHNQDETASFLKWVLVRLCRQAQRVPEHSWSLFQHGGEPSTPSLLSLIETALQQFDHVFITIDAIDESKPRDELLKVLRDLTTDHRFAKVRLLATSREYLDIEKGMGEISTDISMRNTYLDADIRVYTQSRLNSHDAIKNWPQELRDETLEALCSGAKGMFRWVVCQIDVLRKVKRTNAAIRKELKNLPRTLDDTYDRIFESISEEDSIVVQSAMRWICFNDKVFFDPIDCAVLLAAIEDDVSRNHNFPREHHYDIDLLRELCGCLIKVTLPDTRMQSSLPFDEKKVSFAHYTVLEYLVSSRRYRPDRFFGLNREETLADQAEYLLNRAQSFVSLGDLCQPSQRIRTWPSYCAVSAWFVVNHCDDFLVKRLDLANLVINPSPQSGYLLDFLRKSAGIDGGQGFFCQWSVTWQKLPDPRVRTLVGLLQLSAYGLAHLLLQRSDGARLLRTDLDVVVVEGIDWNALGGSRSAEGRFQGSVVNLFAMYSRADPRPFIFFIEYWAEVINWDATLVRYITWHDHDQHCGDWCVVERLLLLGAPADSQDYVVTPLQIAVECLDLEGVAALLRGGATPSAIGSPDTNEWLNSSDLQRFSILSRMTPLEICRSGLVVEDFMPKQGNDIIWPFGFIQGRFEKAGDIKHLIEETLLEYGAI